MHDKAWSKGIKVLRVARDQCVMQRPSKWAVVNHNDFRNGGYWLRFLVALEIEGPIDSVQHGLHSLKKQTKREGIMRRKQVQKKRSRYIEISLPFPLLIH